MDLSKLTIADARKSLDAKEFSSLELTDAYLDAIKKKDGDIHAYLEVWETSAHEEAKKADEFIERGEAKALTGIPLAIKDNILIEGRAVSGASKILENYRATYDATVIKKLKEHAPVFLGRANMDEFAMGGSTENSAFGPTKNPYDLARVPGGSSGGSAAAVAAEMALVALGSDTGGSIRQPASFNNLVGLKPTYGTVSRFGLMAYGSSLDQIGPLTKTVADARILFDAIRGHDENDGTSLPDNAATVRLQADGRGKTIGVPRAFLEKGVDPDVAQQFEKTLSYLTAQGYRIVDIEMPNLSYSLAAYYIIAPAEMSTNLARYDGIRYGLSVDAPAIREVYEKTRAAGFGPEVRRRILIGTFVLSSGYVDAFYRRARAVRSLIRGDFAKAFDSSAGGVDAIALPTSPVPPWKFGDKSDPVAMYAADIFTVPVNLAGVPAISVPSGMIERPSTPLGTGDSVQLPVGFQLITPHHGEETLFRIGEVIERA